MRRFARSLTRASRDARMRMTAAETDRRYAAVTNVWVQDRRRQPLWFQSRLLRESRRLLASRRLLHAVPLAPDAPAAPRVMLRQSASGRVGAMSSKRSGLVRCTLCVCSKGWVFRSLGNSILKETAYHSRRAESIPTYDCPVTGSLRPKE